jgi:hypothetical protein
MAVDLKSLFFSLGFSVLTVELIGCGAKRKERSD